jgi:TonB-linked SusC/RagA family outer membrane protein
MNNKLFRKRRMSRMVALCALLILPVIFITGSLNANNLLQDKQTITGTVLSAADKAPMPGVTIQVKGTSSGTITDLDGKFTLSAAPEDVLVFTLVGYITQEMTVGTSTNLNVVLDEDIIDLDEVVVIGYGVQKKKLNTGSSLSVKSEDIMSRNTTSAMDALQGVTPGVTITRNSGVPGSGSKVYIRGIGTTGSADPLYVVDGIAVENINFLNPSDIESIDILKDGATAAIYGARAANGVVLVSTKKGKKGKLQVTYDGYMGWSNPWKMPEMLNAKQYAEIMDSANVNAGQRPFNFSTYVPNWTEIENGTSLGTNWLKEFQNENAFSQSHAFGFTGGSDRSNFTLGISYLEEQGIFGDPDRVNSTYKRLNLRLNSDHILWQVNNRTILRFGENLAYTNEKNPTIRTGNIYWNDVHNMLVANPFTPVYAPDSIAEEYNPYHYPVRWDQGSANPMADMELQSRWNWNNNNRILGNAYLELLPFKNFQVRSSFGVNNYFNSSRQWQPAYHLSSNTNLEVDNVRQSLSMGYEWTFTNTASYNLSLNNAHNFTGLIGMEAIKSQRNLSISGYNRNTIFNDPEYGYLTNAPIIDGTYSTLTGADNYGKSIASYFGRLSYDYKEKYLLTGVFRRDGSSNFARGNRWGNFWSFAGGWVVSSEAFMESIKNTINYLKIRGSWGQNGNENILAFQYLAAISYGLELDDAGQYIRDTERYFFGLDKSLYTNGGFPPILPNPDVTWETSEQLDGGIDAYFLNNKLQLTFDLYQKITRDWLVPAPALASNGTGAPYINGGDVTNQGFEVMLSWVEKKGEFSYGATATFGHNRNEVTSIANDEGIIHGPGTVLSQGTSEMFRAEVGYPIGYFWGYETDGILQNWTEVNAYVGADGEPYFADAQPGDVRFVDQNDDGVIDDDDKVMIGDPNPDYIYGIQFHAEYKGISIQLVGTGQGGNQIAKAYRSFGDSPKNNYTTEIYDRWTGEGTSDRLPRIQFTPHRNARNISDIYIEDGDFFRISNITIGYDLSKGLKFIPFAETRVYFAIKNALTFTKYSGMDPEIGYGPTGYDWASGIDLGLYPVARTYMVGLSIKF